MVLTVLGKGSYGSIREHMVDKSKIVKISHGNSPKVVCEDYVLESSVNSIIDSFYVVEVTPVFLSAGPGLEMQRASESLHALSSRGEISPEKLKKYIKQLVLGSLDIHNASVIHGDIHTGNILYFKDHDVLKYADFGFSSYKATTREHLKKIGAEPIRAPELFDFNHDDRWHSEKIDIYSLAKTISLVIASNQDPKDPELQDLLNNMMKKDPDERYNIEQVARHPYVGCSDARLLSHRARLFNIEKKLPPRQGLPDPALHELKVSILNAVEGEWVLHASGMSPDKHTAKLIEVDDDMVPVPHFRMCCDLFGMAERLVTWKKDKTVITRDTIVRLATMINSMNGYRFEEWVSDWSYSFVHQMLDSDIESMFTRGDGYSGYPVTVCVTVGDYYLACLDPSVRCIRSKVATLIYVIMATTAVYHYSSSLLAELVHRGVISTQDIPALATGTY